MKVPIYTIGYGNRSLEEFVELLRRNEIAFLVDVRSHPYSRHSPQFSKNALKACLERHNIRYIFMSDELGGRPDDATCYVDGKVNYAVVREKPFYQQGIQRLHIAWEKQLRVVIMCAEAKPQECHRSKLIGETLVAQGIAVEHIDEAGEKKEHDEVMRLLVDDRQPVQPSLFDETPPQPDKRVGYSRKKYALPGERIYMKPRIVTIGVYGFDRENFFRALSDANVDTFCDIRLRRGMRGSTYTFVNSESLKPLPMPSVKPTRSTAS